MSSDFEEGSFGEKSFLWQMSGLDEEGPELNGSKKHRRDKNHHQTYRAIVGSKSVWTYIRELADLRTS
jgi:hypothetical protein